MSCAESHRKNVRIISTSPWRRTVRVAALLSVAVLGTARGDADADKKASVEVCGLRVVGERYGDDNQMQPFHWTPGVTMVLRVVYPEGGIVSFDKDASKIESFADDKGTDLLPVAGRFAATGFTSSKQLSTDGKVAQLEFSGGTQPAKGAREIRAKGVAVLAIATKKESFVQSGVKLAVDTKIKAGPIPFVITKVAKPAWGSEPLEVTLEATQDLTSIAGIRFLDADGKEIESSEGMKLSTTVNNQIDTIEQGYRLARKVDTATIEITCWTDLKTVSVPFDVVAGVGF